ncbi:MAG: AbrB family transcriptional regulator [Clostridiaceae bacterium]|nr:AbrB family transcriptional regulator [Clostridiaceae bacterium]
MRATGYVRKLDALGRIVLLKSLRRQLSINVGDSMEMFIDDERNVVLGKYVPRCLFCNQASDDMVVYKRKHICRDCLSAIK